MIRLGRKKKIKRTYKNKEEQPGNHVQKRTRVLQQPTNYKGINQTTKDGKSYINMSIARRTKENSFAPLGLIHGLSCSTSSRHGRHAFGKLKVKSPWLNTLAPTRRPALTVSSSSAAHLAPLNPQLEVPSLLQIDLSCLCHSARPTSLNRCDATGGTSEPRTSPRNSNDIGERRRQLSRKMKDSGVCVIAKRKD